MSDRAIRIVIVEDEKQIRRFLRMTLQAEGMVVIEAATAREGVTEVSMQKPDLVILDLGLPDRDGTEVIRQLRSWTALPILVLSARGDEDQKVNALDAGADDYLTKPFGNAELLARIRVHLRKRPSSDAQIAEPVFQFGEVVVDLMQRRVIRNGQDVHLTPIEYKLLTVLVRSAGKMLTHAQLLREVWGPGHTDRGHYLRIYMGHLRQKLEHDPARPQHIVTETGIGYRLISDRP
ncbi:two-component system response regulator KdpE [Pollutimonas nitritireducens]|uniref:Two-component system response regulator KdpE n=1 Tax=Pollutimonas nitritireducens TaxID=2045209 RepID=A0A2N4UDV0_9BURK|nr:two-component system response regulator KdpE [Pollutimonas nitritireducens]PLC53193.1 two-component system response regulator KdpE [Pollutimonas nitritireducens]